MSSKPTVDLTVLIPTKNEEITISKFIDWCHEGFRNVGLVGEIVLMDSSTDATPKIASDKGVKVVHVAEKGLGIAYLKGKEYAAGRYVILGDADCTYDFRELGPFLTKLDEGYDLVVGNRFRGKIEKHAMPIHHQYFGSPLTSYIFKYSLGIPTGDIHCGMRALTSDLYRKLPFTELGWEYASEMIVSSRNLNAKICEVPIDFYKEPDGRISHQKRNGWMTPFKAGWGTLRVTASFSLDRFFVFPGTLLASIGLGLNLLLLFLGAATIERLQIGNFSSSLFTAITFIGFLISGLGTIAHFIYYPVGRATQIFASSKLVNILFSATVFTGLAVFSSGFFLFGRWKDGAFSVISQSANQNLRLIGTFNLTISLFVGATVLASCSFLASYMQKLRVSIKRNSD